MRFVVPDLFDPNAHPRAVRRAVGHRAAEVRQASRDHNERIRPLLPPSVQQLQQTQLHDALIQSLRIDPTQRTLQLRLLCDDRDGYFDLCLDYKDIDLTPQEMSLLCLIAHLESAEVDCDEIDVLQSDAESGGMGGSAPAVFVHRLAWNTGIQTDREGTGPNTLGEETAVIYTLQPEIELRFGRLEIKLERKAKTPSRADCTRSRPADFITIVRDPGKIEGMEASFTQPSRTNSSTG
jgi:hypothetical protein